MDLSGGKASTLVGFQDIESVATLGWVGQDCVSS